jgi:hypothetical protein
MKSTGRYALRGVPSFYLELLERRRVMSTSLSAAVMPALQEEGAVAAVDWIIPSIGVTYYEDHLMVSRDGLVSGSFASFMGKLKTDDYSAVIQWGDGQVCAGVIRGQGLNFSVDGSHAYATGGEYDVRVIIRASDGAAAGVSNPVRPFADELTVTRTSQLDNSIAYPYPRNWEQYIGAFADTNPADLAAYTVTIDWGDGTITAGRIQQGDAHNFGVAGTHDYEQGGTYPLTYRVTKTVGDHVVTVSSAGTAIIHEDSLTPEDIRPYTGKWTTTFVPPDEDPPLTSQGTVPDASPAAPIAIDGPSPVRAATVPQKESAADDLFAVADLLTDQSDDLLA